MKLEGIGMAAAFKVDPEPPKIETIAHEIAGGAFHRRDHLDMLAELLETATRHVHEGGTRRIVISLPPGMGKSQTSSVALPLHILAAHPEWKIGLISSEQSLAAKFSRDARRYAPEFGVTIAKDVGQVLEWETTVGGGVIARGIGGALTGRRLKVLIMDDPIKSAKTAYSELERSNLWDWYKAVAKTRLAPSSLALCVMTRWHDDDIAASLIAQGWEEFRIPAIAEDDDDPLGREIGQPLLTPQGPETPEEALERWAKEREEVGEYVWAGLYQQRPAPAGGSIFNPDHLLHVDELPWPEPPPLDEGTWFTSWDLGFGTPHKERKNRTDYTVGTVWQQVRGIFILHDIIRGRWQFTEQLARMRSTITLYPQATRHLVEAAANGAAVIDTMQHRDPSNGSQDVPGMVPVKPLGGKEERWQASTPLLEARKVYHCLPDDKLNPLIAEMVAAPNGKHDDQLDSFSQGLNWGRLHQYAPPTVAKNHIRRTLPGR